MENNLEEYLKRADNRSDLGRLNDLEVGDKVKILVDGIYDSKGNLRKFPIKKGTIGWVVNFDENTIAVYFKDLKKDYVSTFNVDELEKVTEKII